MEMATSMELDRAADAFADWLFDTERIERQDADARGAPEPADLTECSRRHLEWLQRETAKQFHRHMALQAECEWVAAQAQQLTARENQLVALRSGGIGPIGAPPQEGGAAAVGGRRRRRGGRGGSGGGGKPRPAAE